MMSELVSVLISAYNQEKFIKETIESLIAQTYRRMELIVLDDGSKDTTFEKLTALRDTCAARFERVVMEKQQNAGVNETLKRLCSLAQGEYVFFCGADDVLAENAIEKQADFLQTHEDYVLTVSTTGLIDDFSKKIAWDKKRRPVSTGTKGAFDTVAAYYRFKRKDVDFYADMFGSYASLLKGNYISNGFLVRKNALDCSIFLEDGLAADWFFQLQFSKAGKYKLINEPLYFLRCHGTHSLRRTWRTRMQEENTFFFEADLLKKNAEDAFCETYVDFIRHANKKTLCRLGKSFEIYRQKFCLQKCTVLKIGKIRLPLGKKSKKSYAYLQETIKKCL